jgi:hypothetical protein
VGLAFSVGVSLGAQAATTWTVCASGCDYNNIKAAIAASTTLDGDTLAIAAGTYTEPGILVDKSLTLQGEGAASTIVQAAASHSAATDRVFMIPRGVTVTLQGLTIRYGRTPAGRNGRTPADNFGGGLYNGGTLTLTHSAVSGNSVTGTGTGGGIETDGPLTLTASTISGNSAPHSDGGGIYSISAPVTLTASTISGNTAATGGGLYNSSSRLTLTSSLVASNPDGGTATSIRGRSPPTATTWTATGAAS